MFYILWDLIEKETNRDIFLTKSGMFRAQR